MDTKTAFEKWWDENQELLSGKLKATPATAFIIWKASRAAIEIPSSSDSEYWFEGTFQRMRYERDVEKAITSHGIRIKGKTE